MPCRMTFCCLAVSVRPRGVQVDPGVVGDRVEHPREVLRVGAAPRGDGAVVQRQVAVGDDELGVDLERRAEAVARRAGAVRRVEGEVARRRLLERAAVDGAHEVLAERQQVVLARRLALAPHDLQLGDPVGELEGRLERVREAAVDALTHHETVDDHLDGVLLVAGEALVALQELVDVDDLAVDPGTHEPLPGEVLEQRLVLALAAAHDRREHLEAGALRQQRGPGRRSVAASGARAGCRAPGSAGRRCGRRAAAGSRRPR